MADKVKGLYEALDYLPMHYHVSQYLHQDSEQRKEWQVSLKAELDEVKLAKQQMFLENEFLKKSLLSLLSSKNEMRDERDRIFNQMNRKLKHQETSLLNLTQERDTARRDLDLVGKQYESLSQEHGRFRTKVKNFRLTKKQTTMEELICRQCHKAFFESENFNWSCKTHSSEYSGEVWWCCGKSSKDAPGCRKAKHLSKDEDDERDQSTKGLFIRFCTVRATQSCRSNGHASSECPKDPNLRTVDNLGTELERLRNIKHVKKSTDGLDQSTILNQIMIRLGALHPFCSSEQSSDQEYEADSINEGNRSSFFSDVQEVKLHCSFDQSSVRATQNLVETEQYLSISQDARSLRRSETKTSNVKQKSEVRLPPSNTLQMKLSRR
jgi:hypothetical protein